VQGGQGAAFDQPQAAGTGRLGDQATAEDAV
jgi:hypothetical protein